MFAQVFGVKNYFDRWAGRYDRDLNDFGYAVPKEVASMMQGRDILDLGIGTGLCAQAYLAVYPEAHISGVDASGRMLAVCRDKGVADDLQQVDVSRNPLPYADGQFDGVMCGGLIEFIERPDFCLMEAARVLKTGGRLAVAFEGAEDAGIYSARVQRLDYVRVRRMGLWPYPRFYCKYLHRMERVRQICEGAGLRLINTQHFLAYRRGNGQAVGHWLLVFERQFMPRAA